MPGADDRRAVPRRTGVREQAPDDLVLLLTPRDTTPAFHRWSRRDRRGQARPAQLDNGVQVRWTGCGRFQADAMTPAIRRDHAELIGRPCGVCFGDEPRSEPAHIADGLAMVLDRLDRVGAEER